jgi:VIT1/CCC1 family predicted Fe2+/Mn2+ transporter
MYLINVLDKRSEKAVIISERHGAMKHTFKTGFSFGLTSGIITTLGLMVGLSSGTNSRLAVIGGVLVIAIADSLSDALGIHLSEEAEHVHTEREIWEATLSTFLAKFITALTFIVPLMLLDLKTAIFASVAWGAFLLSAFSLYIGKEKQMPAWQVVVEHLVIAAFVIFASHFAGELISRNFH